MLVYNGVELPVKAYIYIYIFQILIGNDVISICNYVFPGYSRESVKFWDAANLYKEVV